MAERVTESQALLTFTEAGRRLGVSGRTVRRQIDAGRLQSLKIGRAHRIRPEALDAFLNASERTRSA
ncbi:MAG: helix-turn-helix domain-containing protein [Alphaproteobacteria bacterium]|jgi:excisionase family DNA binding protein